MFARFKLKLYLCTQIALLRQKAKVERQKTLDFSH